MNSLSWLIYLGEVSGNLRDIAGTGLFLGGAIGGFGLVAWIGPFLGGKPTKAWFASLGAYIILGVFGIAILAFMPSSKTIYMIAASEAGETVVTSPEAKEMLDDLKSLIKRKLKEEIET